MHQLDMYAETLVRHQREAAQTSLEHRQLARLVLGRGDRHRRFYQPVIISLGRRMVVWGVKLQRRYDDLRLPAEITLARQNK